MGSFARVAVCLPLSHTLHYRIPDHLEPWARPGARCVVPIGNARAIGFVVALDREADVARVRDLIEVLDREPPLPDDLLRLGLWLSSYYHHPPGETLAGLLPPAFRAHARPVYRPLGTMGQVPELSAGTREATLWDALCSRGELPPSALRPADARALASLVGRGLAVREWAVESRAAPVGVTRYARAPGAPSAEEVPGRSHGQIEILRLLAEGPLTRGELRASGASAEVLRRLVAKGWVQAWTEEARAAAPGGGDFEGDGAPPVLTQDQEDALEAIREGLAGGVRRTFLLHGVTGSGKTEVYLRAVEEVRRRGEGAIVLVPEIGLTPQVLGRFAARFGGELAVLHSGLGERERRLQWERVRRGDASIAVGARSAVFAPVSRLGLVVVDEEHEASYKQEEGLRYHAKHAALMRARISGAVAVLGSATPDVETYWRSLGGAFRRLSLPCRTQEARPPEIHLVDLRQEERRRRTKVMISEPLRRGVEAALSRGEQALLFLNRRGFSPALLCPDCGEALRCARCAVALTLHRSRPRCGGHLLCHHCGQERPPPEACPSCGSVGLAPVGVGTQRLLEEAAKAWPAARLLRLDRDTARGAGGAAVLGAFHKGEADILVGTQMVAKGHHFPRLTVVGIADADQGLLMPDFRAAERVFQVLTQVAGRAGREERKGVVFVQTRAPHHPIFRAVAAADYEGFAAAELEARREAGFPPFRRLALLRISSPDRCDGERAARELASQAARAGLPLGVDVLGPAPAPLERLRGRFRFQVLLRAPGPEPGPVQRVLRLLLAGPPLPGYRDLWVHPDVDPVSMM